MKSKLSHLLKEKKYYSMKKLNNINNKKNLLYNTFTYLISIPFLVLIQK